MYPWWLDRTFKEDAVALHAHQAADRRSRASGAARPKFELMWVFFQDVAPDPDQSYPQGVIKSLAKVGDKIGGAVKRNFDQGIQDIQNSPGSYPAAPTGFTNGCATRMSYCLNNSGVPIAKIAGQTVTGADDKNYIYRVRQMEAFIGERFGSPDISKGSQAIRADFAGKKGIIAFGVPFSDASGHVTLWNGQQAADEDYFEAGSRHGLPLIGARLWICP